MSRSKLTKAEIAVREAACFTVSDISQLLADIGNGELIYWSEVGPHNVPYKVTGIQYIDDTGQRCQLAILAEICRDGHLPAKPEPEQEQEPEQEPEPDITSTSLAEPTNPNIYYVKFFLCFTFYILHYQFPPPPGHGFVALPSSSYN